MSGNALLTDPITDVQYQSLNLVGEKKIKGSSWLWASCILSNIILGVGLLNFPAAYKDAGGIAVALSVQMGCIVFVYLGMYFIVECSHQAEVDTYHATVASFCGSVSLFVCNVFIFFHNFGVCITFIVILGDQLDQMLIYCVGPEHCLYWYTRRWFTLSVCSLVILPFCFSSRLDGFKFISFVGVLSTLYVVFLVGWKYFTLEKNHVKVDWSPAHWTDIFKVFPVVSFSFEGHIEAVPLYACLQTRNMKNFTKLSAVAFLIPLTIYSLVGCLAYLTLGESTTGDLLSSYTPDGLVIAGSAIIALKAVVTYPEILFCSRMVLDDYLRSYCHSKGYNEKAVLNIETVVLFIVSVMIANIVPTITSVIALLGGSSSLFVFIFPGVCTMQSNMYPSSRLEALKKYIGVAMVVIGCFLAVTTTCQAVMQIWAGYYTATDHCPLTM